MIRLRLMLTLRPCGIVRAELMPRLPPTLLGTIPVTTLQPSPIAVR